MAYFARSPCTAVQTKEIGSGASLREHWGKSLEAARCREIDVVLVRGLDR
jgi:hypothetical protein